MASQEKYGKYRPIREEYSNGESINYSYDEMGNIITKTTTSSLGTEIISYEYDKIGRLTKEIRGNEQTTEYTYDIYGKLKSTKTTVGTNTPVIKTYSYSGNIVTVTNVNTNTVKTLLEYNSNNKDFPNKMFVGLSLENLTWEGNRLKSIGTDITYVYNLAGIRTKKTTPYETTTYVVDGSKIIRMNKKLIDDTVITIDFMYDQNDILVQAKTKEGCYFYVRDITGNINGLIDKNGNYVVKYKYDAWGNVLNTSITQNVLIAEHNPFLYKGYYYDVETQLYWVSSRYYSPELCRFISPDDVEYLDLESVNGLNLYCYCYNDPINYYDPSGHFVITATMGLSTTAYYAIIALLAVTVVAITAYVESETHIIQNSLTSLGNAIVDLGESISIGIDNSFNSSNVSSNNINNTIIGSSAIAMDTSIVSAYGFENVYYYKRKKAAPRIKSNSKKKAREKAFLKGGKRPPIHDPNGKHGPHYHPNDPRFSHWHYYYLWLLLFGDDEE